MLTPLFALGALRLAACGDVVGDEVASIFDLPVDVADSVYGGAYAGHARGRAIAYVREGRLFVVAQDQGIVFTLEPAHGDTPPLVMATVPELATEVPRPYDSMATVALTNLRVQESD